MDIIIIIVLLSAIIFLLEIQFPTTSIENWGILQ